MSILKTYIEQKKVIICLGSGGVGKTTTAASIGLAAALLGKKTLILTIDPARRLANSLGLTAFSNKIQEIPLETGLSGLKTRPGQLHAMMIDQRDATLEILKSYISSKEQLDKLVSHPFYPHFANSLAATHDYVAMETLFDFYQKGAYDLIVLDTPPTRNALDFLMAPKKLKRVFEHKAFQWLLKPITVRNHWYNVGLNLIFNTIAKFVGSRFLLDLGNFILAFGEILSQGLSKTKQIEAFLTQPALIYLIVTVPEEFAVNDTLYFCNKLKEFNLSLGGVVVNRILEPLKDGDSQAVALDLAEIQNTAKDLSPKESEAIYQELTQVFKQFYAISKIQQGYLTYLKKMIGDHRPVFKVPLFEKDIHHLESLNRFANRLLAG